jgi:endonuclease/exonuclease/phosphatase (EEP) superfamily protein YafD
MALVIAAVVLVGPVMRFCVPWRRLVSPAGITPSLRVVTLNADDGSLDASSLKPVIDEAQPDIVAFQAWRSRSERILFGGEGGAGGWHLQRNDELFCASRYPINSERSSTDPPFTVGNGSLAAYEIQTPGGIVELFNIHLATPRRGLLAFAGAGPEAAREVRENIELRRSQMEVVRRWVDEAIRSGRGKVVIMGDFNTPPDSVLYRTFWSGFNNAFSTGGFGFGNTHFTRHTAIRIDHILMGPGWRCRSASVGPNVGSGHRPLMATLDATP